MGLVACSRGNTLQGTCASVECMAGRVKLKFSHFCLARCTAAGVFLSYLPPPPKLLLVRIVRWSARRQRRAPQRRWSRSPPSWQHKPRPRRRRTSLSNSNAADLSCVGPMMSWTTRTCAGRSRRSAVSSTVLEGWMRALTRRTRRRRYCRASSLPAAWRPVLQARSDQATEKQRSTEATERAQVAKEARTRASCQARDKETLRKPPGRELPGRDGRPHPPEARTSCREMLGGRYSSTLKHTRLRVLLTAFAFPESRGSSVALEL